MGIKPEPDFEVGSYARVKISMQHAPYSKIAEIVERDGEKCARFEDALTGEETFPLDVLDYGGRVRFLLPDPVMRLFRPTGGFGNPMPYYGDEFRPEVQLWCVRTLGYTPRMTHEDNWVKNEDGSWPEYDTAWFCYFDSESDKIAFMLAFCGAEILDEFRREDGVL